MLIFDQVNYSYPPPAPDTLGCRALVDISFRVEVGQCAAITGANGSGKSTLCLAAAGLAPRLTEGRIDGSILVAGRDVQSLKPGSMADVIGLVLQDPSGQLFNPTVAEEIAWGLENISVPPQEMDARIGEALALVGLQSLSWERIPKSLSGGEQKRLALATALALRPKVLILDDPSGGLAPRARLEMIDTLTKLREQTQLTILMAESDPEIVAALADIVLVLASGHIVEQGAPRAVYIVTANKSDVPLPPAMRFARTLASLGGPQIEALTVEEIRQQLPAPRHAADMIITDVDQAGDSAAQQAIEMYDVHFGYDAQTKVLKGINIDLRKGEFVVLAGDNGAGKTTLARHLIGLVRPSSGTIRIFGKDTAQMSVGEMASQVGFAFQNPEMQIFNPTVREEIAYGPRNLGMSSNEVGLALTGVTEQFGLQSLVDQPPAALSFSMRRMVGLASIAAMQTPILILDEPTVGLDVTGRDRVIAWLHERHDAGTTILLITHDMDLAAVLAERLIVLDEGRITADDHPHKVFNQESILNAAGLQPPFTARLSAVFKAPFLSTARTPEQAAHVWAERDAAP